MDPTFADYLKKDATNLVLIDLSKVGGPYREKVNELSQIIAMDMGMNLTSELTVERLYTILVAYGWQPPTVLDPTVLARILSDDIHELRKKTLP